MFHPNVAIHTVNLYALFNADISNLPIFISLEIQFWRCQLLLTSVHTALNKLVAFV